MLTFISAFILSNVASSLGFGPSPLKCIHNATYPSLLPSTVVPTHYHLHLTFPDPNQAAVDQASALVFEAVVSVNITVNTATSCIVVHAGNFNYSSITLDGVDITDTSTAGDVLTLHVPSISSVAALTPGDQRVLVFHYVGFVNDDTAADDDGAHGVFLSPNTVPPATPPTSLPSASPSTSVSEALQSWSLHRQQRPRNLRTQSNRRWKENLRTARQTGDPLMIATQFESSDARNMFPSWDEPAYKATFDAEIVVPAGLQVYFNTPLISSSNSSSSSSSSTTNMTALQKSNTGTTTFTFKTTKHPLPTYLVALAVGHFDTLEQSSRGVQYRIITPVGYASWATLALNATIHAAEYFGDKYGLPYSEMNDKMDSISVGGIDMDAMENQGLLTYAPQMLLLNPDTTKLPPAPCGAWGRLGQAQLIMLVTTHEVHHMHFGDTVTMRDWSQEYLNEGFTRFAQGYGVDDLAPDFDMTCMTGKSMGRTNSFFQFSYEVAMAADMAGTAPAIVYPIRGGGDVPAFPPTMNRGADLGANDLLSALDPTKAPLFSRIFYEKGASVNRMVATMLGFDQWFASLATELKRHTWQNPTVEDMMRSLDGAFIAMGAGATAVDAMLPWLRRPGYPVVTLSVSGNILTATQTPISKHVKDQTPWWIPLYVQTGTEQPQLLSFSTTVGTMKLDNASPSLVVGDPAFWGVFVVRYEDDAMWEARIKHAAETHSATPDYTRELLFHITLLVTMSHEKVERLTSALLTLAPILAKNPHLGGYAGESALYTMIMTKSTPIVASLGACGAPCSTALDGLVHSLRTMFGGLSQRLATTDSITTVPDFDGVGAEDPSSSLSSSSSVSSSSSSAAVDDDVSSTPWPSGEDAGLEASDRSILRPLATLAAVVYNDAKTVEQALAMFRNTNHTHVHSSSSSSSSSSSHGGDTNVRRAATVKLQSGGPYTGPLEKAVYYAAGKYGTVEDYNALVKMINSTAVTGDGSSAVLLDVLFGLTATAGSSNECVAALHWTSVAASGAARIQPDGGVTSDQMVVYTNMLTYAFECRTSVEAAVIKLAQDMLDEAGLDSSKAIKDALNLFSSSDGLKEAASFLKKNVKYISAADAAAVLVNIHINIDMVHANSK